MISFNMNTPAITRSSDDDVTKLNSNFVVYGYKTPSSGDPQVVFDNYQVKWVINTAGTTESNSANWEYVSYKNLPYGTGTKSGETVTLNNNGVATNATATGIDQSIKYWDFATGTTYKFFAYSLGAGVSSGSTTWAMASAMNKTGYGTGSSNPGYTLSGTQAQLGTCYISKLKNVTPSSSTPQVQLQFVNFLSKIQLKFFETIPGYSVKDVKFYTATSTKSTGAAANDGLAPALYTASTIPTAGTYTITFDANYDPVVTLTSTSSTATSVQFEPVTPATTGDSPTPAVWLSDYAGKDYNEADETVYLGRTSNAATASKQISVLPNSTGAAMTLKMDYTLVSRDGSGEVISVTGATATVPADFTKWKPNYAYTYIFKISDNTDAHMGSEVGLYPITFDASVVTDVVGNQTTITTVATPSITTYAKDALVDNEYKAGNIYVVVNDGTVTLVTTGDGINAKLYTATLTGSTPAQGITEETVANALTKTADASGNYVLTDALGGVLTVTPVASNLTAVTSIPADDAPGGKAIDNIKAVKFTATAGTTYVFEYIYTESSTTKKAYKVIKVASGS